jgi:hypothetical protein
MAMHIKQVSLEYRFLPITLAPDGTTQVAIRKGYEDDGVFVTTDVINLTVSEEETSRILDVAPLPGMTRRQDLIIAIFAWCKQNGHIDSSTEIG